MKINLSKEKEDKLKIRAKEKGFKSVESYVLFVLEQLLKGEKEEDYTEEQEKQMKEHLKDLGYL